MQRMWHWCCARSLFIEREEVVKEGGGGWKEKGVSGGGKGKGGEGERVGLEGDFSEQRC